MKKSFLHLSLSLFIVGLGACSARPAIEVIPEAELAILAAKEVQAETYAPNELAMAQESLAQSREALAKSLNDAARRAAEKAFVDAEYAAATAQNKRTKEYVIGNAKTIEKLKK